MRDWVGLVESSYDLGGDVETWLGRVLDAAAPLLDQGAGLVGWVYTLSASAFRMDEFSARSANPQVGTLVRAVLDGIEPAGLRRLHASPPEGGTLSTKIFRDHPDEAAKLQARSGGLAADAYALLAPTATGRGAVLAAPLRTPRLTTSSEKALVARIAAHIGAGLRLRLALEQEVDGEAVLDAGAKLHHAAGPALQSPARELLREAVKRREQARTRRERADPEAALVLWEGLVAGRWSLVDRFDSDGKRFVVAHRNDPEVGDPRGLTQRERQIAEYLGLGRSMKETAYALGITTAAVSNAVKRAAAKLGMSGRAELASFFSPLGIRARLAEFELAGESLAAAGVAHLGPEAKTALSDAERDVALDLLRGATVTDIAARRARSPATVETQVKAIYEKMGVGSRVELATRLSGA